MRRARHEEPQKEATQGLSGRTRESKCARERTMACARFGRHSVASIRAFLICRGGAESRATHRL